ncbi:MAG: hypothetical protein HYU30_01215 [Chloroflexi bacterium]|nr:hypothetical protein [Chloroflexota bacterium]
MKKSVATGYAVGIIGLLLALFALLAPARLVNAAREQLPVNKTAIVDANFPERSASVDAFGRLKVDVPDFLHVQVANFPPMQQVQVTNKSLPVDGTVKVSNLPAVQSVTGVVNVGNLPARQNVNVINETLPVSGSVAVSNLPATQNVTGTVNVGNLPSLDPANVMNLFVKDITAETPAAGCSLGFRYVVPSGKTVLMTDFVPTVGGLTIWSSQREAIMISVGLSPLHLDTPLVANGGDELCFYRVGGFPSFDNGLFISGLFVNAP